MGRRFEMTPEDDEAVLSEHIFLNGQLLKMKQNRRVVASEKTTKTKKSDEEYVVHYTQTQNRTIKVGTMTYFNFYSCCWADWNLFLSFSSDGAPAQRCSWTYNMSSLSTERHHYSQLQKWPLDLAHLWSVGNLLVSVHKLHLY